MKSIALIHNSETPALSSESLVQRAEKTETSAEVIGRWKVLFKVPTEVKTPYPDGTMYLSTFNSKKLVA